MIKRETHFLPLEIYIIYKGVSLVMMTTQFIYAENFRNPWLIPHASPETTFENHSNDTLSHYQCRIIKGLLQ